VSSPVETILVSATESFTEVVLVFSEANVPAVSVAAIFKRERILETVTPAVKPVRPASAEALCVSVSDRLPQLVSRESAYLIVLAGVIVPIDRRSVDESERVQPHPITTEVVQIISLELPLRYSVLLSQERLTLLSRPLLLVQSLPERVYSLLLFNLQLSLPLQGCLLPQRPLLVNPSLLLRTFKTLLFSYLLFLESSLLVGLNLSLSLLLNLSLPLLLLLLLSCLILSLSLSLHLETLLLLLLSTHVTLTLLLLLSTHVALTLLLLELHLALLILLGSLLLCTLLLDLLLLRLLRLLGLLL